MPKVSVIIPVYNTEKYISQCLDSVCRQTLKDIEIICINDCSADSSFKIVQDFAQKDSRIRLIDFPENKGAAAARNAGIEAATGEYVGFVDSDDFVDLDFYEKLYVKAKETGADAAKGNYKDAKSGMIDFSLNDKIRESKNNFAFAYCSAIFNKKVIDAFNICFPLLNDMEDPVFTVKFAYYANNIAIDDSACINIVKREDSVTGGVMSLQHIQDKFFGLNKIIEFLNLNNVVSDCYSFVVGFWLWQTFINSMRHCENSEKKFIAENILKSFDLVLYKEEILNSLEKYSLFFVQCLKKCDFNSLYEYNERSVKANLFLSLRNKVKREYK